MGMALFLGILIFMAVVHPEMLSVGAQVLGPNYLGVYGWASIVGIILQVVVHEVGTLVTARRMGLPLHYRFFGFGANATAILEYLPRRPLVDAKLGFAGPLTGTAVTLLLTGIFALTNNPDKPQIMAPFFLGMACVGFFITSSPWSQSSISRAAGLRPPSLRKPGFSAWLFWCWN